MGYNETSRFQRYYLSRWPPLTYKSLEIDRNEFSLALDYSANYRTKLANIPESKPIENP